MKKSFTILLFLCAVFSAFSESFKSPDGNLFLNFSVNGSGVPVYSLSYKGRPVVADSRMGLLLKNDKFSLYDGFEISGVENSSFREVWNPVWGEESAIENTYNQMKVSLLQKKSGRTMIINFRLYNDGLGFRYEFPQTDGFNYFVIKEELTEFAMTGNHTAYWIPGDYDSQEYEYTKSRRGERL